MCSKNFGNRITNKNFMLKKILNADFAWAREIIHDNKHCDLRKVVHDI